MGKVLTRGEEDTSVEVTPYKDKMVLLEFPDKESIDNWFSDSEYQKAMKIRHASSTMNMLLVQEGGSNTLNPNPKLDSYNVLSFHTHYSYSIILLSMMS
ncbi:MAG: DUF1330 domain-containing protein [Bacteroidetes bacterium]|nr:DUF1330 domain-containing protein [Bacteroidota bacterium]